MREINFIQSTSIGAVTQQIGLFEIFLHHLAATKPAVFTPIKVIVPNLSLASWLEDKITETTSICSNISFVLLNEFMEEVYLTNNPGVELFDFEQASYIIYDYLCSCELTQPHFQKIYNYLVSNGVVKYDKAFQLAKQLQTIFHEYIYLRTPQLMNLELDNKLEPWQKQVWQHLVGKIGQRKTYVDIYQFFTTLSSFKYLPNDWFIFGLTSIYPSQLAIVQQLAKQSNLTWYYLAISNHYYGDLLSNTAKAKLEQKILCAPQLHLSDLYLADGNPLVANLGGQSREFNELLLANEVLAKQFELEKPSPPTANTSLLHLLQYDVREILQRIDKKYRLNNQLSCYAEPILLAHDSIQSLKINVCYTRMREVQVLFNELMAKLSAAPSLALDEILVTAPDIDLYAPYIEAVFNNEFAVTESGKVVKIPFTITGNKLERCLKVIDMIKFMFNLPYHLPVSYLLELLGYAEITVNLGLTVQEVATVQAWLQDNNIHFGYDANDYALYKYSNFDINSFKRFLVNLALGACLPAELARDGGQLPLYSINGDNYTFYDNLENSQLNLCNKLIKLVDVLVHLRHHLYTSPNQLASLNLSEMIQLIEAIKQTVITKDEDSLIIDEFIGKLRLITLENKIDLAIFNQLLDEFCAGFNSKVIFTGKLTCASMQVVRNLPYKVIYVLGMNFGEFPRFYNPNKLSLLATDWAIADRNLNLEDKQLFLDILLAAQEQLYISYIGRNENDNQENEPATVVSLLKEVIKNSLVDGVEQLGLITELHSLHPFYNNCKPNYSAFWGNLSGSISDSIQDKRWDFSLPSPLSLSSEQRKSWYNITSKTLINTFLYTNTNLYSILKLDNYIIDDSLSDCEDFSLTSRDLRRKLYNEFKQIELPMLQQLNQSGELSTYLHVKGAVSYQHIGDYQLNSTLNLYYYYMQLQGKHKVGMKFYSKKYDLTITDEIAVENNNLIICEDFVNIRSCSDSMQNYKISLNLRVKCLIYLLLAKFAWFWQQDGSQIAIDKVYLRLISLEAQQINYEVRLIDGKDPAWLWGDILQFYLYSLTNPVLVHKAAIEEYANAREFEKLFKAQKAYEMKYQNNGLEELLLDPVLSSIAMDYFDHEFTRENNTIIIIGELLRNLNFVEAKVEC